MDNSELAPTSIAIKGLVDEKNALIEEGVSETDALRMAATTMDGAGDNRRGTVESLQTCYDLGGKEVKGLTGKDIPEERHDEYAENEEARHSAADAGEDEAAKWLRENDPSYKKQI
jgi:hypothetical protein